MSPKETPVGKAKCPVCKAKLEEGQCSKCGHLTRPSD